MTRLQKKCLFAAAGAHLLVIVVVFCSGFVWSKPKVDETQLLDVIPSTTVETALNSGAKNAPTPPPAPVTPPTPAPPTPPPTPEPPKPVMTPPTPPKVEPSPPPDVVKPAEKPDIEIPKPKPPKREIKIDLTPVVRDQKQAADAAAAAAKAERDAKRQRDQRLRAIAKVASAIKENSSSATTVEMPGASSVSYANYASVVKSIYERDWTPPDSAASDDANVKVSVTIGSDGTVVSSHVVNPSGDSSVDGSVQRTLDHVNFVAPFPDGAKEKKKTFIINFNLKAKRMFG